MTKLSDQYNVNPDKFIAPSTPIVAYILGLLWADGYVKNNARKSVIALTTTYPDADIFIPLFLKTGIWRIYSRTNKNHPSWRRRCEIKTNNRPIADFLVQQDYESKSIESADKILSTIPSNLQHYWFRGFLDGDGHIHSDTMGTHNISFSGPYNQKWNFMEKLCDKLNLEYSIHQQKSKRGHQHSKFCIYGMYKVIKLCKYIYQDYTKDAIGLSRKHNIFLNLMATEEKNRYRGVSQLKNGKWRAYTSCAGGGKWKSLGVYTEKEKALEMVEHFYSNHPKCFLA
jgi:hypothetical protein